MKGKEKRPAFMWLGISVAVVAAATALAYFLMGLSFQSAIALFFAGLLMAGAVFFAARIILSSNKMPDGWADPVIDLKKEFPKSRIGTEGPGNPDFISDTGKLTEEELGSEYLQMGRLLLKSDRFAEAKDNFVKATERDPGNSKIYNYLGIACGRLNHFDEAIDAYNKAVALDYDYASAHFNLATVYEQVHDAENAIKQWQRYIDIGQVVGEREDMLQRARDRLNALKNGTGKFKARKPQLPNAGGMEPE